MENADRIDRELRHELAGIWYISDKYGAKILVKLPSSTIKAILKGCLIEMLFAVDVDLNPNILLTGLRVYDDLVHPQVLMNPARYRKDHLAIIKIMHLGKVQVQLCNELNAIQSFGDLYISDKDRHDVHCLLGNPSRFYIGQDFTQLNLALDKLQAVLNQTAGTCNLCNLSVKGTYQQVESIDHSYVGAEQTVHTNIDDPLEGNQLEKEIYVVLRSLFIKDAYHGPLVKSKTGYRELIDIFAISDFGVFLIEAKALGVYEAVEGRTMERKVLGLQKQVKKAIAQLVGASRTIIDGTNIFSAPDKELLFDRTLFPHGIVLISEMLPFGDWESTIRLIINTMAECKMFVHVMDLQEILQFVGYSNNERNIFDDLLMQRAKKFIEQPTVHSRYQFFEK
jgi:hypothetical protein